MRDEMITSLQNPKIKDAKSLKDRRDRDEKGLFLVEGYRELSYALTSRFDFETLFYAPEFYLGENEEALLEGFRKKGARLIRAAKGVFEKLSYRDRPDGLLGIAKKKDLDFKNIKLSMNPFLVIAESIEKPGNLGSILRSSDAAGADCVIIANKVTDIYNPNVIRSSVGAFFTMPVFEVEAKPLLAFLKENKILLASAMPEGNLSFTESNFKSPLALAVGAEQFGLSPLFENNADLKVRIPMGGKIDSLNVASAATLLLYEVYRQRTLHPL